MHICYANWIAQNKIGNPFLKLLINSMSAPKILSIKNDCTVLLLNFLIIVLCNSSANSLL